MKKTFIILSILAIAVIYFNCGGDSTTNPTGPTPLTSITGTIENWTLGAQTLKLQSFVYKNILDSTQISASGSFDLKLPTSVSESYLDTLGTGCVNTLIVTPNNLKGTALMLLVFQNNVQIGYIMNANTFLPEFGKPYISVNYFYFNSTGTVKGTDICYNFNDSSVVSYDMSFSQGWNPEVYNIIVLRPTYSSGSVNSTIPTGLKWYFVPHTDLPVNYTTKLFK